jgi:putative transposase
VKEKSEMIEMVDSDMSIRHQCELLGLNRGSFYYDPQVPSNEKKNLMRMIEEIFTKYPYYGVRRIRNRLWEIGIAVGRKLVKTIMRIMGLVAIIPTRNLSKKNPAHKIYPYLLRGVKIDRINQVWSTDITYIRLGHGFVYLTTVIDWHSRYVLAWRLSNSLDADFCVECLKDALQYGKPEIFNTDQGSQFTSAEFTKVLLDRNIAISMDGRGRALDNIFIERLWRTVKYENVYLKGYQTIPQAYAGLREFFDDYNMDRGHQSLGYKTPWGIYSELVSAKVDNVLV